MPDTFPALLALGVSGIPTATMRDDAAALAGGPLKNLAWPDGSIGIHATDVIVFAAKFIAKCEGRLIKANSGDDDGASPTLRPDNVPAGLAALPPADPVASAKELRRALNARFGGRPGVIITGRGPSGVAVAAGSAGIDSRVGDANLRNALATMADAIMAAWPGTPVVVIRGAGHLLTYEDQAGTGDGLRPE